LESSKEVAEEHRKEGRKKMLAEEAEARKGLFGNIKRKEGESEETFFDRCATMDRRMQEARVKAVERFEASQRAPPTAKKWGEVQDNFLKRWKSFNEKREKNLQKLDEETKPPFRIPGTDPLVWADVADHFLESQKNCIERIKARVDAAEAELKRKGTKEAATEFKTKLV